MKDPALGTLLLWLGIVTLGVALLAGAVWLSRLRVLVASAGTFPARRVSGRGRGSRVIVKYDETRLELYPVASLLTRPCFTAARADLQLDRVPLDGAGTGAGERRGHRLSGAGAHVVLEMDDADAYGLRAWIESGPSMVGHTWWSQG